MLELYQNQKSQFWFCFFNFNKAQFKPLVTCPSCSCSGGRGLAPATFSFVCGPRVLLWLWGPAAHIVPSALRLVHVHLWVDECSHVQGFELAKMSPPSYLEKLSDRVDQARQLISKLTPDLHPITSVCMFMWIKKNSGIVLICRQS